MNKHHAKYNVVGQYSVSIEIFVKWYGITLTQWSDAYMRE